MSIHYVTTWVDRVKATPEGLGGFHHVPTVRGLLNHAMNAVQDLERIASRIETKQDREAYILAIQPDLDQARQHIDTLNKWLADRGEDR